ncbi:hypothetical protein L2088_22265 [Pseudomonas protegens]|uniref:hypothetical protein n=1 Tax=Pseudomonas protegens TaxID=380021 RepID=UPI0020245916|nr:hypothetical protein [Pseudomonas protegens]MCL9657440.1 hypothetical protein [Pseudomonas protegens]
MSPFSRVVALDDKEEDLDIIVKALGRAGYSAIPYLFDLAAYNPQITNPCAGLRLIFSDIHLTPTSGVGSGGADHAAVIGNFLKLIVPDGPYGLIFWSKHEADEHEIVTQLSSRSKDIGFKLPVFFGFMDKKAIGIQPGQDSHDVDYDSLRDLIREQVEKSPALKAVMDWEERVLLSAARASNSLFEMVDTRPAESKAVSDNSSTWLDLLTYLSQEAVGIESALSNSRAAIDNALLPVLEDQLRFSMSGGEEAECPISKKLIEQQGKRITLPVAINKYSLNSFYLVENLSSEDAIACRARGVVSIPRNENVDFISTKFGSEWVDVLYDEFVLFAHQKERKQELATRTKPCLISLSAECDEVQGKIPSHRYLLGIVVEESDLGEFFNSKKGGLARAALQMIGCVKIDGFEKTLIVSCRRFMSEHSGVESPLRSVARLRRSTLDELIHHYTTYARRPGVMRF